MSLFNSGPGGDARRPLLDTDDDDHGRRHERTRTPGGAKSVFTPSLGTAAAYGMIISIVIGSGVFTSSGSIDTNVPSPGIALVIWLVGGVLAWTGATTMAELGTAIPGEGMFSSMYLLPFTARRV